VAVRGRGSRGCSVGWLIVGLLGLAFLSGLVVFIRKRRARPSADDTLVADLLGPPELPEFAAPRTWDDGPRAPAPQAQKDGQPARAPRERKDRWPPRGPRRASRNPQARDDGQQSPAPGEPPPDSRQPSPSDGRPSPGSRPPAPALSRPSPAPQVREDGPPLPAAQTQENDGHPPASPAPRQPSPAPQAREEGQPSPAPSAPPAGAEDWLDTQLAWINAWSQRMKEQITSGEQPERHSKE
jgi:hypothetical protein